MMKKLLIGILAGAASLQVLAVERPVYIDLNAGINTSYGLGLGLGVNAGYLFNRYFGVEGGFTSAPSLTNFNGGASYYMFDGAVKGILPLGDVFSLYGKLGLAYNGYSCSGCSSDNLGLLMGVGAQLNLTQNWGLHLEDYTSTGANPNLLMFGVDFKF